MSALYNPADISIDLKTLAPEILLAVGLLLLLPLDLLFNKPRLIRLFAALTCFGALTLCLFQWQAINQPLKLFAGHLTLHPSIRLLHACMLAAATLSLTAFGTPKPHNRQNLCMISFLLLVIGSIFLTTANTMMSLYIAIELTSIPAYILCTAAPSPHAKNIAFRYMLWGMLASATMLFGCSILYAKTNSLFFQAPSSATDTPFWLWLMIAALLFKMALVPFQRWVVEVYSILPIAFLSYLATSVKIAACIAIARLSFAFQDLNTQLWLWSAIAIISYTYGNIAALRAQNLRTLLAYSAIAYGGFLILPILQPNLSMPLLWVASAFYLIAHYLLFAILHQLEQYDIHTFNQYPKLPRSHRILLSIPLACALFALIGLPPTLGFSTRWFIFTSLWTHATHQLEYIVVVLAILNSILAIWYYLKPLLAMNLPIPEAKSIPIRAIHMRDKVLWMVLVLTLVIGFGYAAQWLHMIPIHFFFD